MQPSESGSNNASHFNSGHYCRRFGIAAPGFAEEAAFDGGIPRQELFSPAGSIPGSNGIRDRGNWAGRIRGMKKEGRAWPFCLS